MEKQGEIKEYAKIRVGRYREILIAAGITALIAKLFYKSASGTITVFSCVLLLSEILCKKRAGGKKTPITAGI